MGDLPHGWGLDLVTGRRLLEGDPVQLRAEIAHTDVRNHLLTGTPSTRAMAVLLARANLMGGTRGQVREAVRAIERSGAPERYFAQAEQDARRSGWGYQNVWEMPPMLRLALEMASHEETERRALEILEALGLEGEKFTYPLEEMSRGMQQKVAITRALLVNPPLLLLDEPTTGLDPKSRRDVQTFLESVRRENGTTILLTSHDMAETERLCARIGFIAHGRLIAEGTADELKRRSSADSLDDAFIALAGEKLDEENGSQRKAGNAALAKA